jgi:hypothetical protein
VKPFILCRERLSRIQFVLNRAGGKMSVRNLMRSFEIRPWEVEQAAALGWVKLYIQPGKGGRGRSSRIAEIISPDRTANLPLPPYRNQIPREISVAHQLFAMRAVWECVPWGIKIKKLGLRLPGIVTAYLKTYNPRSYAGARASASRLCKHPNVRAVMRWERAKMWGEIPAAELIPVTERDILVPFKPLSKHSSD